jgi:hypothetical protein
MLSMPDATPARLDPHTLSPAEREQIKAQREEILRALINASVSPHDAQAAERVAHLAIQYGYAEVDHVETVRARQMRSMHLITDEATHYRTYRRAFAVFGADKPFFSRTEFGERVMEHAKLVARRQLGLDQRAGRNMQEVVLAEQLFPGVHFWENIAEPAVPAHSADFHAPAPGAYGAPAGELLAWGPPAADDEAHAARVATLIAQDSAAWHGAAADLARMATDPGLLRGWPGEAASWGPYHALDALGALGAADQADALLALLDEPDDWLSDRLPHVWAQMGAGAEAALWAHTDDAQHSQHVRAVSLLGLSKIAEAHPARRPVIVKEMIARLRATAKPTATYNAYLIFLLDEMDAVEAR